MPQKLSENSDKISYYDFAKLVLLGENLEDKLISPTIDWSEWKDFELPKLPGRTGKIAFSDEQIKFPKSARLNETDKKAIALHSFANHELLAIEMMAAALLIYPHKTEDDVRFKRGILTALKEEQKHLSLYIGRLNQLGYQFGDFPLNDFFWRQMEKLKTPSQYAAVMALTFEAANLDFAQHYARLFREFGDIETAQILEIVLEDEIGHVAFGAHWMKKWREDKTLWQYYMDSLPWPLTPARSKGIGFDPKIHERAMSDQDFIQELKNYDDQFQITKRT
ncbi:DUF455 family protein [Peredibacter sp. HCB2-198]|uniref:DUF455 family protein n=1 Tax=Peredibacter sp. HCB2-198 TaxID=3383025 RepID=UPI0038B656FF